MFVRERISRRRLVQHQPGAKCKSLPSLLQSLKNLVVSASYDKLPCTINGQVRNKLRVWKRDNRTSAKVVRTR